MGVLKGISPTIFNVYSLTCRGSTSRVFSFLCLEWHTRISCGNESVKRGYGFDLNGVISPPQFVWEAFLRLGKGGSRWILAGVATIMLVANLSHSAADFFLDFVSVEGSETGDVPVRELKQSLLVLEYQALFSCFRSFLCAVFSHLQMNVSFPPTRQSYQLHGDKSAITYEGSTSSISPVARFMYQIDAVAKGISRLSIFPPDQYVYTHEAEEGGMRPVLSGIVNMAQSELMTNIHNITANPVPNDLQVRCEPPTKDLNDGNRVIESVIVVRSANKTITHMEERNIPRQYEETVPYKTIEKKPGDGDWQVLDWLYLASGPKFVSNETYALVPFGSRNIAGTVILAIVFSFNETDLA